MKITLNGKTYETPSCNIRELLAKNNWNPEKVVAELNGEIVQPANFEATSLADGDVLEVIQFVGGG